MQRLFVHTARAGVGAAHGEQFGGGSGGTFVAVVPWLSPNWVLPSFFESGRGGGGGGAGGGGRGRRLLTAIGLMPGQQPQTPQPPGGGESSTWQSESLPHSPLTGTATQR